MEDRGWRVRVEDRGVGSMLRLPTRNMHREGSGAREGERGSISIKDGGQRVRPFTQTEDSLIRCAALESVARRSSFAATLCRR
jgi:hypothetical protein